MIAIFIDVYSGSKIPSPGLKKNKFGNIQRISPNPKVDQNERPKRRCKEGHDVKTKG